MKYKVLLIEDDKVDQMAFERLIKTEQLSYNYTIAGSVSQAKAILDSNKFDIIITDYNLGDGTAFDIFTFIIDTPIILVTGAGNEEIAVTAMKGGTYDYLVKDPNHNYLRFLPLTVENAIKYKKAHDQFRMLSHAIMSISDSVYITDMDDKIIYVNKAFCDTYRFNEDEIIGKKSSILSENGDFNKILSKNNNGRCECYHKRKDNSMFPVSLSTSVIKDENNQEVAIVGVTSDITEQKRLEDKLKRLSFKDGLTGLANRRRFDEIIQTEWKRGLRNAVPVSIVMIDVDFFKPYNDIYGHQAGDECLRQIAEVVGDSMKRAGDLAARYGGEEFVVILPKVSSEGSHLFAESLRANVENKKMTHLKSKTGYITISLGVATTIPTNNSSPEELILSADEALYKAKQKGRNRVEISI